MRRGGTRATVVSCAVALATCNVQPQVETPFAQYVEFGQSGVSTDFVLPPTEAAAPLLGEGWAPWTDREADRALWVYGHDAEFRFFSALPGEMTLVLEAQAFQPPGSPPQALTLSVNGQLVDQVPLEPNFEAYEVRLPREVVLDGWNHARMEFRQALRAADFIEGSQDRRPLAARFRRIALRSSLGRSLWPDRPPRVAASVGEEPGSPVVIDMPTDSVFDVFSKPAVGQELVGSVEVHPVENPGQSAVIGTSIELLDAEGETIELFRAQFGSTSDSPEVLRADLSEWIGELVRIRVRAWGDTNSFIRWKGLGLSASTTTVPQARGSEAMWQGRFLRPESGDSRERPDVVVIMLDAARADAFRGSEHRPSTPNIDALATDGTHFSVAWATSSWTGQSVPSIFTGYYPDAVGAEVWGSQLPTDIPTLAELFSTAGYFTALWTQHGFYEGSPSLQRGYQALGQRDPSAIAAEGRAWLPDAEFFFKEDRPTFAMIHLLPPHDPYEPPAPFRGRLTGWYGGDLDPSSENLDRWQYDMPADEDARRELIAYAQDRYLENVEFADHLVGQLVQMLKDAGRYRDAIVVVLSDHGEAFFEHDRFLHTIHLYEEFIRVPFFIKWPSWMSGYDSDVTQPVTLVDLAPTLLEGLQIDGGPEPLHGTSLLPLVFEDVTYDRGLYAYTRRRRNARDAPDPEYAFRAGSHKILYRPRLVELELYDLEKDPGEQHDLSGERPLLAGYLLQEAMLQRSQNHGVLARSGPQQNLELDRETRRRLRALGYVQ